MIFLLFLYLFLIYVFDWLIVKNDLFINQKFIYLFLNSKLYSIALFNFSSFAWTKLILTNNNLLRVTFFPQYLLYNYATILSIHGQFSYQKIQINDSISFVKFPSTDLYRISLLINGKEISSFQINVTTQIDNLFDSFFDCKNISNSLQCVISNACLSSKGLTIFGYGNNIEMTNFSFIIDPMKSPKKLNIYSENDFNEHSFIDVPAIFADLQSQFTAFFHLVTETVFPFCRLFDDYNLLNSSKIIVLKRKPISILQYFPILNANVTYLNEKKCYKKLIIGFPKYNGYYDPKFLHFLDPELFNYNYRKIWRSIHENYFVQNKKDKKINLLFINRPLNVHRSILNYEKILNEIKTNFTNINVVYSEFSNISLYKQINLVLNTDILITIHGSAEAHMLLLKDNALMIEIMPYLLDKFINLYMNIANMTKLKFIEFHASKSSSLPKRKRWIREYEQNPKVLCNGMFRSNIRNQNIILNEDEINLLLNLIKNHIKY